MQNLRQKEFDMTLSKGNKISRGCGMLSNHVIEQVEAESESGVRECITLSDTGCVSSDESEEMWRASLK